MKLSGRTSLIILISGFLLLVGILFHAFILENFVQPVALALWLFWRFLQVFDQHLYWGILILGIFFYAFYRLIEKPSAGEYAMNTGSNATLEILNYWWTMILLTRDEIYRPNALKRELGKMLAGVYISKYPEKDFFEIYSDLRWGEIPLPEPIYTFLFYDETAGKRRSILRLLDRIRTAPVRAYWHLTGRDVVDYYHSIEEVLIFADKLMETSHDVN